MDSVYEKITSIISKKLEEGIIPWHQPWTSSWPPRNLVSQKPYRGINLLLLSGLKYELPYFLTFKQVKYLKGSVMKGEKAHLALYYDWEKMSAPKLILYHIFNIGQCKGIASKHIPWQINGEFNSIDEAEYIANGMPSQPQISYDSNRACYIPQTDQIIMPSKKAFSSDEELYSTLFHELCHSTGHESRLNRKGVQRTAAFGSKVYSQEELIAEIGAAILCGQSGIENRTIDNSSEYIRAWFSKFKDDKRMIVFAAGAAQKACDFILDRRQSISALT